MSPTCGDIVHDPFTYRGFNHRTVAEIQEKIAKRGGQGLLSRFGHAKNDKEAIASWRSDLNAIINILNVGSVVPAWPPLNVYFQTELAVNTRANGSGVRRDVVDTREVVPTIRDNAMSTQPIIRDVQNGIINTRAPVSDAYRNMARSQEGTRSHRYSVNSTVYQPVTECSPFPRIVTVQRVPMTRIPRSWQDF